MKCEECLPLIEGFVEQELDARGSQCVEAHLAACPACAEAYAEQAREQEIYSSYLLDIEASPALWDGLRAAIREENARRAASPLGRLRRRLAFNPALLSVSRARGGALPFVAASLALAAAFFYTQRPAPLDAEPAPAPVAVAAAGTQAGAEVAWRAAAEAAQSPTVETEAGGVPEQTRPGRERRETYLPSRRHYAATAPVATDLVRGDAAPLRRGPSVAARARAGEPAYLVAGERAYRKPIAELAGQIEARGDEALPPALRAEYRRGLAAVNRAISDIREDALRHPDDPNLAEFLRAAYRGKLDLLASAAEQGEAAGPTGGRPPARPAVH